MSDEELKQLIASNAKAIQALSNEWRKDREEWRKDRRHIFDWMARLAAAQADFYEVQADYLHHIENIDNRLTKILERLTEKEG